MDPGPGARRPPQARIPRTRGDGPPPALLRLPLEADSPHARGWTFGEGVRELGETGFPARAGMDRWRGWRSPRSRWIPRTRGDGPRYTPSPSAPSADSPHARGWTRLLQVVRRLVPGFPARAGMDPSAGSRDRARFRIPRTRGDGPHTGLSISAHAMDSPHARGWTHGHRARAGGKGGFPARAGMDRPRGPCAAPPAGIPRTRGDGPHLSTASRQSEPDSPHARGWTRVVDRRRRRADGFPARAGMDRRRSLRRTSAARIPRTRGDGPHTDYARSIQQGDSPHARGWTRAGRSEGADQHGFPARAGMDPGHRSAHQSAPRIPRTRGDGPSKRTLRAFRRQDSPHARGWTPQGSRHLAIRPGFPARAGMDPRWKARSTSGSRIPRTRGDGPVVYAVLSHGNLDSPHARGWTARRNALSAIPGGFPARAGMDPVRGTPGFPRRWIPRTRGDGPSASDRGYRLAPDSPHARGWTTIRRAPRCATRGFPARAGMDPKGSQVRAQRRGIPRTRGDGPACVADDEGPGTDSPHARGWTPVSGGRVRVRLGFPARAGMDPRARPPASAPPGIPRTRGDGPRSSTSAAGRSGDSPHARGWTRRAGPPTSARGGFPARAGMDLAVVGNRAPPRRIPRTRGDGPSRLAPRIRPALDSPHARGWTRQPQLRQRPARGFPARAGMDPRVHVGGPEHLGIPRTRGDGPRIQKDASGCGRDSPHARGWTR